MTCLLTCNKSSFQYLISAVSALLLLHIIFFTYILIYIHICIFYCKCTYVLSNFVDNYMLRTYVHLIDLDDFWASHPELHDIPIYYASALAKKCMSGEL